MSLANNFSDIFANNKYWYFKSDNTVKDVILYNVFKSNDNKIEIDFSNGMEKYISDQMGPIEPYITDRDKDFLFKEFSNGNLHFKLELIGDCGPHEYFYGYNSIPTEQNGYKFIENSSAATNTSSYTTTEISSPRGNEYYLQLYLRPPNGNVGTHYQWDSAHTRVYDIEFNNSILYYKVLLSRYEPEYDSYSPDQFLGYIFTAEDYVWIPSAYINTRVSQRVIPYLSFSEKNVAQATTNGVPCNPDDPIPGQLRDEEPEQPQEEQPQEEQATDDNASDFSSSDYLQESMWYEDLYWFQEETYSAKSFDSIVGMPIQFMGNVDMRFGASTFGKQYSEDILYDAPICIIDPGAPQLADSTLAEGSGEAFTNLLKKISAAYHWGSAIINGNGEDVLQTWLKEWLVGTDSGDSYARFYGFESQYARYIQYVNTLCHLFATYLGISEETIPGTNKKYKEYDDTIEEVEYADNGLSMKMKYGSYPALFVYYQPDSSLSQTFSNQTQESSLASKLNELSNYSKEMAFLAGGLGFPGKGVTVGEGISAGTLFSLGDTSFNFGSNNIIKRIFSRAGEGVGTIIGGNNLIFPEIYNHSSTDGSDYTLNIKLVNPYGSPEGAFLFQLRHLARLLAVSVCRQYGANGYTAPFIIRAFSKGQFNIQLGIVQSLSIRRAGSGGENQTVHHIPMELEVTMVLKDMYQQIAISNEYTNAYGSSLGNLSNIKQLKLLFNNIGLLDFVASYAGYNLNQPSTDIQLDFILNSVHSNLKDIVDFNGTMNIFKWKFPRWERALIDSFKNAIETRTTWLS